MAYENGRNILEIWVFSCLFVQFWLQVALTFIQTKLCEVEGWAPRAVRHREKLLNINPSIWTSKWLECLTSPGMFKSTHFFLSCSKGVDEMALFTNWTKHVWTWMNLQHWVWQRFCSSLCQIQKVARLVSRCFFGQMLTLGANGQVISGIWSR